MVVKGDVAVGLKGLHNLQVRMSVAARVSPIMKFF